MIKHEQLIKVTAIKIHDNGFIQPIAWSGKRVKVIEISDMNRTFLNHQYTKETLMTIHESEWKLIDNMIDYAGG